MLIFFGFLCVRLKYFVTLTWYIMACLAMNHLAVGFVLGFPAILSPALTNTSNNTDVVATRDQASWIAAAYGMTGSFGFLILPGLMQMYGRRFINVLINLITLSGSVIIALSPNVTFLIAGRSLQGIAFGQLYITSIIAAEYSQPKRRGFFIVLKITASSIGVLICHSLGFSWTWREMAWLACLPPALAALGTVKWPESPSWLAYKGRYEECSAAFEWLRGSDAETRKELIELISVQKAIRKTNPSFKETLVSMRSKEFLRPFVILAVIVILLQVCGRHYLLAYLVEIMVRLTGDKSKAFYYTIGLDLVKILAILMSSLLVKMFKRRTLLFFTGALSCFFLGSICVFHILEDAGMSGVKWLTPVLLIVYTFVCNVGVIPVCIVLKGELFPIKFRGVGTCVIGVLYSLLSMATLKLTSPMLAVLDTHGTFAIYLLIAAITLVCLYFILPETKDRTMQNIELDFIELKLDRDYSEIHMLKEDLKITLANK